MSPQEDKTYYCEVVSTIHGSSCQLRLIDPKTHQELGEQVLGLARNFTVPARPNFGAIEGWIGTCQVQKDPKSKYGFLAINIHLVAP